MLKITKASHHRRAKCAAIVGTGKSLTSSWRIFKPSLHPLRLLSLWAVNSCFIVGTPAPSLPCFSRTLYPGHRLRLNVASFECHFEPVLVNVSWVCLGFPENSQRTAVLEVGSLIFELYAQTIKSATQ